MFIYRLILLLSLSFLIGHLPTFMDFHSDFIESRIENDCEDTDNDGICDDIIEDGFSSNTIYEFASKNNLSSNILWVRTGAGLCLISFNFSSPEFHTLIHQNLPDGGNPGFDIFSDTLVVSGSKAIFQNGAYRPMGTGVSWSINSGNDWSYMEQSVDEDFDGDGYIYREWGDDLLKFKAITTSIYNVSYGLAILNDYIYASSFAGGLRRFKFKDLEVPIENPIWELVPLPMDDQDSLICNDIDSSEFEYNPIDPPIGNDNHKAFSVFADELNNIIWVGTGNGINKGTIVDGCIDWIHFDEDDGLGDRWVIRFRYQEERDRLWAITWDPSGNQASPHTLNYTDDLGQNWNIVSSFLDDGLGTIVYDLYFEGDVIYAATDKGLYTTVGENLEWDKIDIEDSGNDTILSDKVYTVYKNKISDSISFLWVGTPDGKAYSDDNGITWFIDRYWDSMSETDNDMGLSAFPNPFYVDEHNNNDIYGNGKVRIIHTNEGGVYSSSIDIFDFSMEHINTLNNAAELGDVTEFIWDGRNKFNKQVVNGVYFLRLTVNDNIYWTKLMVINS